MNSGIKKKKRISEECVFSFLNPRLDLSSHLNQGLRLLSLSPTLGSTLHMVPTLKKKKIRGV